MKKVLVLLAVFSFLSFPALAVDKYGVIDLDIVIDKYSKTKIVNADIKKQEEAIQKYANEAKAKMASVKTNLEKKELETKYTKELESKLAAFRKSKIDKVKSIRTDIDNAIQSVGKSGNYALIVPNTAALYGGTDVTEEVVKVLNAKK